MPLGILISDNFHAAVGDMILCLVQFFCRKYDVPWNAEVLVASALNDADFEEKMKALYRCAIGKLILPFWKFVNIHISYYKMLHCRG